MANEELILDAFKKAGNPLSAKELSEACNLDKKEVDKVIKQLKNDGKIHSPKRCYYEPVK